MILRKIQRFNFQIHEVSIKFLFFLLKLNFYNVVSSDFIIKKSGPFKKNIPLLGGIPKR